MVLLLANTPWEYKGFGLGRFKSDGTSCFERAQGRLVAEIHLAFHRSSGNWGSVPPKLGLLVIPVMLGLTVTSCFTGRYWCGNICVHGSLFDHVFGRISKKKAIPKFLKSPYLGWGIFTIWLQHHTASSCRISSVGNSSFLGSLGICLCSELSHGPCCRWIGSDSCASSYVVSGLPYGYYAEDIVQAGPG